MTELVLNNGDIPWEVLKRRGFESVRLMELTRFYLQLKEDPHGPNVALFVGNLPPNLKQKEYETILLEYLDEGIYIYTIQLFMRPRVFTLITMFSLAVHVRFTSIGPIYYEYGSMVITFDSSNMAVIAYEILKNRRFEEKKLLVIMLPTIEPSMIPPKVLPLLVFVNVKSGGCQVIIIVRL